MKKVGLIDTGIANFGSINSVLSRFGYRGERILNASQLDDYSKLILPGVGKFDAAMQVLNKGSFSDDLKKYLDSGDVNILGICLGMQLMCNKSEEGKLTGLKLIDADVVNMKTISAKKLRYPHMGWNHINIEKENKILNFNKEYRFYFVHSYCVKPKDKTIQIASCNYGDLFCAAFQKNNIYGVQFHPERSHKFGLELFENFLNL